MHCRNADGEGARRAIAEMEEMGIPRDGAVYGILMQMHVKCRNIKDMERVKREMEEAGVPCGSSIYAILLQGYIACRDVEGGLATLQEMSTRGVSTRDSEAASRLLIMGINTKDIHIAKQTMEKRMEEARLGYDAVTYNWLLHLHMCRGDLAGTKNVLEQMRGLPDGMASYDRILELCIKHSSLESAKVVLAEMVTAGVHYSEHAYLKVRDLLTKCEDVEGGRGVLAEIAASGMHGSDGWHSQQLEEAYIHLMRISSLQGNNSTKGASSLLQDMVQFGVPQTAATYNFLAQAYAQAGDAVSARAMQEGMRQNGLSCTPLTYNLVLQLYVADADIASALALVEEMEELDVAKDGVTYSMLLNCFSKQPPSRGSLAAAERVLDEMGAEGLELNDHHFAAMLRCCGHNVHPERAEHWFRRSVAEMKAAEMKAIDHRLASAFSKAVGMPSAVAVCADLGFDLMQVLQSGKHGKHTYKGSKSNKGGKGSKGAGKGSKGSKGSKGGKGGKGSKVVGKGGRGS
jgi:pentatricopeptide repeat protein